MIMKTLLLYIALILAANVVGFHQNPRSLQQNKARSIIHRLAKGFGIPSSPADNKVGNDELLRTLSKSLKERRNFGEFTSEDEPLLFNIAVLLSQKGEHVAALEHFNLAAKLNANRDATWFSIAQIHDFFGRFDESIAAYKAAISVASTTELALASYNNMVPLLVSRNRLEEAAKEAEDAVNLYPTSSAAWSTAGLVMRAAGNLPWAASCFEKALEFTVDTAVIHNNLGALYARLKRADDAVRSYERAVIADPTDDASLYSLALLMHERNKTSLSQLYLQQCKINSLLATF